MKSIFKYELLGKVDFGNEIECILKLNGITDIDGFLNPNPQAVENPHAFKNIDKAASLLLCHLNNGDCITIVVDSDADGYTSASLIYQYILKIYPDTKLQYVIHNGKEHGLSDVVFEIINSGCQLVIVPDAGTSDVSEIEMLKNHNVDVIILDHHICTRGEPYLNDYHATVVNNQMSENITDKAMTGVGVTYKFCKILDEQCSVNYADDFLDLLCLGMIADRCNMLNPQSRFLILQGLTEISEQKGKNLFIRTLVEAQSYSLGNEVTINGIGFYVAPLVNSLIRYGTYEDKCYMFEAFCNSDKTLIRKVRGQGEVELPIQEYVLKSCQSCNRIQKAEIEESIKLLTTDIEAHDLHQYPVIVCNAKDSVDKNATGLIANKLTSVYKKPCLVLRRYGDVCSGSARGFSRGLILNFNKWCVETKLFDYVEGHDNAFGISIPFKNTDKLFNMLSQLPASTDVTYPVYNVYDNNTLSDVVVKNIGKYSYLWGSGVEEPLFAVKEVVCNKYNINLVGLKQNRIEFSWHNIEFVMFSKGGSLASLYKDIVTTGENINFTIIGKFNIDTFKGSNKAQVLIEDLLFEKSDIPSGFGF